MMTRVYLSIIILAILGGLCYTAYNYVMMTRQQIATLRENGVKLESSVKESQKTITRMQEQQSQIEDATKELRIGLEKAEVYQDELNQKLRDHNLTKLSAAKPGLIQKRVNEATSKLFKEMEEITSTDN
jgi:hypothetical protein